MTVAIIGSRAFSDLDAVRAYVWSLANDVEVISGGARGVDQEAEEAARNRGLCVRVIRADWRTGRGAGYIRNHHVVAAADRVVAFWDGQSRGTAHTIDIARANGKPVEVRT